MTDIAISPDESYFVTLGEDNIIVFYPLSDTYNHPLYQPLAGRNFLHPKACTSILIINPKLALIGGDDFLTFVSVNLTGRQLSDTPVRIPLRRRFNCLSLINGLVYAGTEQGDVM